MRKVDVFPGLLWLPVFVLAGFGILFLGVTGHELWHARSHWVPTSVCFDFGSESFAHTTYQGREYEYFMNKNLSYDDYVAYLNTDLKKEETEANWVGAFVFFGLYAISLSALFLSYRLIRKGRERKKPPLSLPPPRMQEEIFDPDNWR